MSSRRAPEPPAEGGSCVHHPFERAERVCRDCGHWLCDQCLVTPWGVRKAALCINCAIGRSGVRSTAARAPVRSEREIRKLERQGRDDDVPPTMSPATAAALHRAAPAVDAEQEVPPPGRRSLFRRFRPS